MEFKKIFIGILAFVLFSNNVFAKTIEEELTDIINIVPEEYTIKASSDVDLTSKDTISAFIYGKYIRTLLSEIGYASLCISGCVNGTGKYIYFEKIDDENYNLVVNYGYFDEQSHSWESYNKKKKINIKTEIVENDLDKEDVIHSFEFLNMKEVENEFAKIPGVEVSTTIQRIRNVEKENNIKFVMTPTRGSDIMNKEGDMDVSWYAGYLFGLKNDVIYKIRFNDLGVIDTTLNLNGFFPKLSLGDYIDIDDYIDDSLKLFENRTKITNYSVKIQDDNLRYKFDSNTNYYNVEIINLDDNTEWSIYFTGTLTTDSIFGDLNGNGDIDLTDVILLLKNYLNQGFITDNILKIGDMNKNGKIDLSDVIILLKMYLVQ